MTSKDRVLAALRFDKPDRIPRFDSYWPEFEAQCRESMNLSPTASLYDHFHIDMTVAVPDESPWPSRKEVLETKPDGSIIQRNSYGMTVRTKPEGYFEEELGGIINEPCDLNEYPFDMPEADTRFAGFVPWVEQENKKGRCVFGKIGGPFIRSTFIRGKTEYLLDLAADEEFAKDLAQRVGRHLLGIALEELKRSEVKETGIWIFDDMAYNHAPLFSPGVFERVFLPIYRNLISTLHAAGCPNVYFHSDGNIELMLDMLVDAGIAGINPVEPRSGMSMTALRKRYPRLALIGGMCNSVVLVNGSQKEIERQAAEIIDLAQDGGVIIGAHSIGPDIPLHNYLAYVNYLEAHGEFK